MPMSLPPTRRTSLKSASSNDTAGEDADSARMAAHAMLRLDRCGRSAADGHGDHMVSTMASDGEQSKGSKERGARTCRANTRGFQVPTLLPELRHQLGAPSLMSPGLTTLIRHQQHASITFASSFLRTGARTVSTITHARTQ